MAILVGNVIIPVSGKTNTQVGAEILAASGVEATEVVSTGDHGNATPVAPGSSASGQNVSQSQYQSQLLQQTGGPVALSEINEIVNPLTGEALSEPFYDTVLVVSAIFILLVMLI